MHPISPVPPRDIPDVSALRRDIVKHITARRRKFRVNGTDIEDLAQSALAKIFGSIANYRPERGDFRAWAFGIVHNVLCHHARNEMRYSARFSEIHHNINEYEASDPSPEQCLQQKQAGRELAIAAENVDSKRWAVVTLHAIDDLSHRDIGRELRMSEAASQKCFQRTRNRLAQCLDEDLLAVMPVITTTCQDKPEHRPVSRWSWVYHGSHYTGQIASLITIGLLTPLLNLPHEPRLSGEISQPERASTIVMPQDQPPLALPEAKTNAAVKPTDKRDPPSAPKIPLELRTSKTTPKNVVMPTSPPAYNPPPSPAWYRQRGR